MANPIQDFINVKDYTLVYRQMSRNSGVFIPYRVFTLVIGLLMIDSQMAVSQHYPVVIDDCFGEPQSVDLINTRVSQSVQVAWSQGLCGLAWVGTSMGSTSVNFSWFDVNDYQVGRECLGDVVKVADLTAAMNNPSQMGMASDGDGQFVVVWAERRNDLETSDIRFALVSPQESQDMMAAAVVNEQWRCGRTIVNEPVVAGNDSLFVIAWIDDRLGQNAVYLRRYEWTGKPIDMVEWCLTPEAESGGASDLAIAVNQYGTIGVVWCEAGWIRDENTNTTRYGKRIHTCLIPPIYRLLPKSQSGNSGFLTVDMEFSVICDNGDVESDATAPRIAGGPDGTFVVVWQEAAANGGDIVLNQLAGNGEMIVSRMRVDQAGDHSAASCNPDVSWLSDGLYLLVWDDVALGGTIFSRIWDARHTQFVTSEYSVEHPVKEGRQVSSPHIAVDESNYVLTTWLESDAETANPYFTLHRIHNDNECQEYITINDEETKGLANSSFLMTPLITSLLTTANISTAVVKESGCEDSVTVVGNQVSLHVPVIQPRSEKKIAKGWRNLRRTWNSDKLYNVQLDESGTQSTALQAEKPDFSAGHGGS